MVYYSGMNEKTLTIAKVTLDPAVKKLFRQTANSGLEHTAGSLPQLKVTEANSNNVLADGKRAKAGTLYYSPTKESFKTLNVSLLAVSRGFYTRTKDKKGEPKFDDDGNPETKFNQLVGGVILETLQPFIMFASGTRWPNLNKFVKYIRPLTKNKDNPTPMYSLVVKLDLEEVKTKRGFNNVVAYSLVKDKKTDHVQITSDPETATFLSEAVESAKDMFDGFITRFQVDRYSGQPIPANELGDPISPGKKPPVQNQGEATDEEVIEALDTPKKKE